MAAERKPEFFAGKDMQIGIIGCGYVGLPLALRFADVGHRVVGFDLDQTKVDKLNAGQSYIQHIPADKIREHVANKRFSATSDFTKLRDMDAVLICVPTPLDERREPDLSYVENTEKAARKSRRISTWRFHPSVKTPETSNTAWRRFPKSSAESIPQAGARRWACTRRS